MWSQIHAHLKYVYLGLFEWLLSHFDNADTVADPEGAQQPPPPPAKISSTMFLVFPFS